MMALATQRPEELDEISIETMKERTFSDPTASF